VIRRFFFGAGQVCFAFSYAEFNLLIHLKGLLSAALKLEVTIAAIDAIDAFLLLTHAVHSMTTLPTVSHTVRASTTL